MVKHHRNKVKYIFICLDYAGSWSMKFEVLKDVEVQVEEEVYVSEFCKHNFVNPFF